MHSEREMAIASEIVYNDLVIPPEGERKEVYKLSEVLSPTTKAKLNYFFKEEEWPGWNDNKEADRKKIEAECNQLDERLEELLDSWCIRPEGIIDQNDESGLVAYVIETGNDDAIVAFRGTEKLGEFGEVQNEKDFLGADIALLRSWDTAQQTAIEKTFLQDEVVSEYMKKFKTISATGHSLGGNNAMHYSVTLAQYGMDDKLEQCVALDPPGFSASYYDRHGNDLKKIASKTKVRQWSFVSAFFSFYAGMDVKFVSVKKDGDHTPTSNAIYDEDGNLIETERPLWHTALSYLTTTVAFDPFLADILCSQILIVGYYLQETGGVEGALHRFISHPIELFGCLVVVKCILLVVVAAWLKNNYNVSWQYLYELANSCFNKILSLDISEQIKSAINSIKSGIGNLIKSRFEKNSGNNSNVSNSSRIVIDTTSMMNYSSRIARVIGRLQYLTNKMRNTYYGMGNAQNYGNALLTNRVSDSCYYLGRCQSYLIETVGAFEQAETEIQNEG